MEDLIIYRLYGCKDHDYCLLKKTPNIVSIIEFIKMKAFSMQIQKVMVILENTAKNYDEFLFSIDIEKDQYKRIADIENKLGIYQSYKVVPTISETDFLLLFFAILVLEEENHIDWYLFGVCLYVAFLKREYSLIFANFTLLSKPSDFYDCWSVFQLDKNVDILTNMRILKPIKYNEDEILINNVTALEIVNRFDVSIIQLMQKFALEYRLKPSESVELIRNITR